MFICTTCLETRTENFAVPFSHGKCELCDTTDLCVDIHHSDLELKHVPEPKKTGSLQRQDGFAYEDRYFLDDDWDANNPDQV